MSCPEVMLMSNLGTLVAILFDYLQDTCLSCLIFSGLGPRDFRCWHGKTLRSRWSSQLLLGAASSLTHADLFHSREVVMFARSFWSREVTHTNKIIIGLTSWSYSQGDEVFVTIRFWWDPHIASPLGCHGLLVAVSLHWSRLGSVQ